MINVACPNLGLEEKSAVNEVIDSGMIACGNITTDFEKRFAGYIGANHGIATTSGTTALEVALRALGLGQGDKILTTAYSFIATTNAYMWVPPRSLRISRRTALTYHRKKSKKSCASIRISRRF